MLSQQARKQQDRSKPSLSQVRLEMFKGSRTHYKEWKRTIEAQRALYRLDDAELSMLIYLSCQGEPRQILNQLQIEEMREPATECSDCWRSRMGQGLMNDSQKSKRLI